jgi:hypothetical protein
MLERLDAIDWTSLVSAGGQATDVPTYLRELLSDNASVRERAMESLTWHICHQSTIYAATLYAVPFLLELLNTPEVQDKQEILDLLASIAEGAFPIAEMRADGVRVDLDREEVAHWNQRTHAAVRAGRDLYLRLLSDHAIELRRSTLRVLVRGFASDAEQVVPEIRRRCARETDRTLRACLLRCLSMFAPVDDETRALVTHTRMEAADPVARLAATSVLARVDGERAPTGVETDLVHALVEPNLAVVEAYTDLITENGTFRTDYIVDLALALRAMGPRGMAAALPPLVDALAEHCARTTPEMQPLGHTSLRTRFVAAADGQTKMIKLECRYINPPTRGLQLAEALLVLTFGKRRGRLRPGERRPEKPNPAQQRVLEAISVCEAIWYYDASMDWMLDASDLPPTREGLVQYVTGGHAS